MSGEVELVFLKRLGERWQFKVKPHPRFDQLINDFSKVGLFSINYVYFTPGSGFYHIQSCYEISEDGMWFLRPHFANWEKVAGPVIRDGAYYYNPMFEERKWGPNVKTTYLCSECGKRREQDANISTPPFWECPGCRQYFCEACSLSHGFTRAQAENIRIEWDARFFNDMWVDMEFLRRAFQRESTAGSAPNMPPWNMPKNVQDAFKLLGVAYTASVEEINQVFKLKAKDMHPDRGGKHEDMAKLSDARDVALGYVKR